MQRRSFLASAVKQGLMTEYNLFESVGEGEAWNLAVAVGYPTEQG